MPPTNGIKERSFLPGFTLIEIMVTIVLISILVSISVVSYVKTKRKTEYDSACGYARTLTGAVKSYFLAMNNIVTTTSTADSNSVYGTRILDGYFQNYSVNNIAGPPQSFNMTVFSGTATQNASYTFNSNGTRIACVGTDCLP